MGQQNPLPYDTSRMTSFSSVGIIPVIKASPKKKALQAPINQLSINYQPYLQIQKDVWSTGNVSGNGGKIP